MHIRTDSAQVAAFMPFARVEAGVLTRRLVLGGTAMAAMPDRVAAAPVADTHPVGTPRPASYFAYVGCRTSRDRNARGDGITVYSVDAATGRWQQVQLLPGLLNPSFLALSKDKRFLYTVHGDSSEISSFTIDAATGRITPLNQQSTQGKNPVHLSLDPTGRFMVVCNHITSTLAVLPVDEDGALRPVCDLFELKGKIGPHRVEQPFSKPHEAVFAPDGRYIIVPDKGLDRVFTFAMDRTGKLAPAQPPSVQARETSGPRHVAFRPDGQFAYVVNELDSTVTSYRYDAANGALTPMQIIPTLPQSFTGDSRASEIEASADGRFIYASNRGFDSVAILAADPVTGWLSTVDVVRTHGKTPRFFALAPDGRFMFVAHEDSDTIAAFTIDQETGRIAPTDNTVTTGSPVCIVLR
jgi:6-phosphogluconolactonase